MPTDAAVPSQECNCLALRQVARHVTFGGERASTLRNELRAVASSELGIALRIGRLSQTAALSNT